ncbi:hypothetical protein LAZ67_3002223 [Cordylochernes scorpioides]|uniref:Transposase n=1 Tax=Cordylochernes scorpioides TaxID=51811 RepID=A0ABY6K7P7_9ARAC|nr:hypothetical protein LAZ67_3002223 [Cordylochernes scorpioides]
MSLVPKEDIIKGRYYLPHHPVIKEKSCTTKLRVVFDASAKTDSGLSLNDALIPGPKIQQDLFHIILRFRIHPVAINADIAKMYRKIRISQEDSEFQRIVWRNDPHDKIKDCRLETVTYGTSCAPFLATRIIKQLALDEQITGTCSVDEGNNLVQELYGLLRAGGFELRKWTSNVPDVLSLLPNHLRSTNTNIGFEESKEFVNILGLQWQPRTDGFTFKGIALPLNSVTKRGILSQVAKIFDPLGWISPFTTTIKLILQELWKTGLEWDDPIPEELRRKLTLINQDLPSLEHIQIPRCVVPVSVYGEECMSIQMVRRWRSWFLEGRQNVHDDERSGRPVTATDNASVAAVRNVVEADRRVTIDEIIIRLPPGIEIGRSSIGKIMSDILNFRKVCARWVPRLLLENHKQQRMEAARAFLEMHQRDGDQLFSHIVTGDESWVHHSTPETKRQSMVWKKPEESAPKKAKVTISAGKVMAMENFKWEIFTHPPYSPELAPSDFHLFPALKWHLGGKHFANDDEVQAEENHWLRRQDTAWYNSGIKNCYNGTKIVWTEMVII